MVIKNVLLKQITSRFRKLLVDHYYSKARSLYDKHVAQIPALREIWIQEYRQNLNERKFNVSLAIASAFENTREWIVPAATSLICELLNKNNYKEAKKLLLKYPVQYFSILDVLQKLKYEKTADILIILEAFEPEPRRNLHEVLELMETALATLQDSKYRQGFLFELPEDSELVITGDLHGNRRNLDILTEKIQLKKSPNCHIIFQEILHSRSFLIDHRDVSFLEIIDILELLVRFPNQVHLLLGNHDLNFLLKRSSMRSNRKLDDYFFRGIEIIFGTFSKEIIEKYKQIITWMAAAIRCGPLLMTHSNPENKKLRHFNFQRLKKISPLKPNETIDLLVSGRDHSHETVQKFLENCRSEFSIIGHEFCRKGYSISNPQQIIIDSCHNLGTYLHCTPQRINCIDDLKKSIYSIRG